MAAWALAACGGAPASTSGAGATALPNAPAASSVPAGLPVGWSTKAIEAANTRLQSCAQANTLQPSGCPQRTSRFESSTVEAAHWTLRNGPLAHAVAVPVTQLAGIAPSPGQVEVYGRYQMDVSYTVSGQSIRPFRGYSGGIAHATMSWDGHSFQNVQFDLAWSRPRSDVVLAVFARPNEVSDAVALAAVKTGFEDCVTLPPPLSNSASIPNCPQGYVYYVVTGVTVARWVLTNDPMQGALVSFNTEGGYFAVTGNFSMNLNYHITVPNNPGAFANGDHTGQAAGKYTATLVWDGHQLHLIKIEES